VILTDLSLLEDEVYSQERVTVKTMNMSSPEAKRKHASLTHCVQLSVIINYRRKSIHTGLEDHLPSSCSCEIRAKDCRLETI